MSEQVDLDALEALAKAATPGPWEAEGDPDEGTIEVNAGSARTQWSEGGVGLPPRSWRTTDRIIERDDLYDDDWDQAFADAAHIEAFDPPTSLALIARLREAEAVLAEIRANAAELLDADDDSYDGSLSAIWAVELIDRYKTTKTEGSER